MTIPWSEPDFENLDSVQQVLNSGWLTQGKETERFEQELTDYFGNHVVVCNNGTNALIMALLAHNIGEGDEVIIPAYTFIATYNAVLAVGAKPVLVDCNPRTFNIDAESIEKSLLHSRRIRAMIPVDVFGMPVNIDELSSICNEEGWILIEDAAEAIGASYNHRLIGSFNHTAIFSFHAAKLISTIEGGCIVSPHSSIIQKLRLLRNHGMTKKYQHETFGLNYRITDLQSAIGRVQLSRLDKYLNNRQKIANIYYRKLKKAVDFQYIPNFVTDHPYMIFSILTDRKQDIITRFICDGIGYRECWNPIHKQPFFRKNNFPLFDNSEKLFKQVLSLPIGNIMKLSDAEYVADVILDVLA